MARGAIGGVHSGAEVRITSDFRRIRRWRNVAQHLGFRPRPYSSDNRIDLFAGEHADCALCECGHWSAGHSVGDGVANGGIVSNGKKNWVAQCDRRASPTVQPVTCGAVLPVKNTEVDYLIG